MWLRPLDVAPHASDRLARAAIRRDSGWRSAKIRSCSAMMGSRSAASTGKTEAVAV
jgi:hypothetical protein